MGSIFWNNSWALKDWNCTAADPFWNGRLLEWRDPPKASKPLQSPDGAAARAAVGLWACQGWALLLQDPTACCAQVWDILCHRCQGSGNTQKCCCKRQWLNHLLGPQQAYVRKKPDLFYQREWVLLRRTPQRPVGNSVYCALRTAFDIYSAASPWSPRPSSIQILIELIPTRFDGRSRRPRA